MSLPLHALIALVGFALTLAPSGVRAQNSFQTSLTATISRLAPEGAKAGSDTLGCRQVSLHWRALPGARRYVVYVSATGHEPWVVLPPNNVCGASEPPGATGVTDVQPTAPASTRARTIYYMVVALADDSTGDRAMETTTMVSVRLRQ